MSYHSLPTFEGPTPLRGRERDLWVALVTLLVLDVVTTWYVVSRVGLVAEANPAMASVMASAGFFGLVASKLIVLTVGVILREFVDQRRAVPLGAIVVMTPVAIKNTMAVLSLVL